MKNKKTMLDRIKESEFRKLPDYWKVIILIIAFVLGFSLIYIISSITALVLIWSF